MSGRFGQYAGIPIHRCPWSGTNDNPHSVHHGNPRPARAGAAAVLAAALAVLLAACPGTAAYPPPGADGPPAAGTDAAGGYGGVRGRVTADGAGAPGVTVNVAGTALMAVTRADGGFEIGGVPAGNRRIAAVMGDLTALFPGYVPVAAGVYADAGVLDVSGRASDLPRVGENGNWWLGGLDLGVPAEGETPRVGENGNWWVGGDDLGIPATGGGGEIPRVGENGNWWAGDRDLGIPAEGETPRVGENGNWWLGGGDLGIPARTAVSVVWKGDLAAPPANPGTNWAFFSTRSLNAYIWNGSAWDVLTDGGAAGDPGGGLYWLGTLPDFPVPGRANQAFRHGGSGISYAHDGVDWQPLSGARFVPTEGVSVAPGRLSLPRGRSRSLSATVYPPDATITAVLWTSDNPDVVAVDPVTGLMTALSDGTARITATALSGRAHADAVVEVVPGLPSLHLSIAPNVNPNRWVPGGPNELHRDIWRFTTVSLRGTGEYEQFNFEGVRAQARGRGNSSWGLMNDKRPLRIRFDAARSMFGSSYLARDWTLIANAVDHSMMRSFSAYFLGSLLGGLDFSPTGHFLHLYMDGEYRGVYMLSDQIHVHEGRVELSSNTDPALSEYFLEWCRHALRNNEHDFLIDDGPFGSIPFVVDFPGSGILDQNLGHREFARDFVALADAALVKGDFDEISKLIDISSFIDYFLVQDLFKNMDISFSSLFFQIRLTDTGHKLFAGPLWDFDLSSGGNTSPDHDHTPQGIWASWFNRFYRLLMEVPRFKELVGVRWNEIRDNEVRAMIAKINQLKTTYQTCFEHNFYRWPDKNVWVTAPGLVGLPFVEQVRFLTDWLEQRKIWMDEFLQQTAR